MSHGKPGGCLLMRSRRLRSGFAISGRPMSPVGTFRTSRDVRLVSGTCARGGSPPITLNLSVHALVNAPRGQPPSANGLIAGSACRRLPGSNSWKQPHGASPHSTTAARSSFSGNRLRQPDFDCRYEKIASPSSREARYRSQLRLVPMAKQDFALPHAAW
jgi:hypothetical protein